MPREAVRPSSSVARALRAGRTLAGLSLSEVSKRVADLGAPIPTSTIARIETGHTEPGAIRLHQLMRLYGIAPSYIAECIDIERLNLPEAPSRNPVQLLQEGKSLWKAGQIRDAFVRFVGVRDQAVHEGQEALRQDASISLAIAAQNVGQLHLAKELIEDVLLEGPPANLLPNCLVSMSQIWQGLGSLQAALGWVMAAQAIPRLEKRQVAFIGHQLAHVQFGLGQMAIAQEHATRTKSTYAALGDSHGEIKVGLLEAEIAHASADSERALQMAHELEVLATQGKNLQLQLQARIAVGKYSLATGRIRPALEALLSSQQNAVLGDDKSAEFQSWFYLWKAYCAAGDDKRAQGALQSARHFLQFVEQVTPESIEIRAAAWEGGPNVSRHEKGEDRRTTRRRRKRS